MPSHEAETFAAGGSGLWRCRPTSFGTESTSRGTPSSSCGSGTGPAVGPDRPPSSNSDCDPCERRGAHQATQAIAVMSATGNDLKQSATDKKAPSCELST